MEELIAKKYVKALINSSSLEELENFSKILDSISLLFKDKEISSILYSPEVNEIRKSELILEAIKDKDKKIKNLIKLLAEKRRLSLIPIIAKELKNEISKLKNEYRGKIYSESKLKDEDIKKIEETLSKKVGAKIVLTPAKESFDGMKVEVDSLGIEISFSKSKIKTQIIEHILKAI